MVKHGRDEPRERELDIPLALTEQLADLKRRMTHLETLEAEVSIIDFVALDKVELAIDTATITFASISGIYAALKIIMYVRTDDSDTTDFIELTFNNDTGANYDWRTVMQTGSRSTSANNSANEIKMGFIVGANAPSNVFSNVELIIPDYANTANQKTLEGHCNARATNFSGGISVSAFAGFWRDNSAITEIDLVSEGGSNFVAGSSIYLYGLRASP